MFQDTLKEKMKPLGDGLELLLNFPNLSEEIRTSIKSSQEKLINLSQFKHQKVQSEMPTLDPVVKIKSAFRQLQHESSISSNKETMQKVLKNIPVSLNKTVHF